VRGPLHAAAVAPDAGPPSISSAVMLERARAGRAPSDLGRKLRHAFTFEALTPVVGAMPAAPGTSTDGPPPFIFGLAGLWR
jgi:hypothetical protein